MRIVHMFQHLEQADDVELAGEFFPGQFAEVLTKAADTVFPDAATAVFGIFRT